uniref:Protein-L-isoaspartate O-methyltransferase n=2 Tax=Aureimonas frigidaquae TaxID=424757 RepID=A0A0P0Z4E9_9HYPH|nr:hypothetical protein [Aureimonas frigidaquae]
MAFHEGPSMDFAQARTKMVDNQVRTSDVTDHEVLRALLKVPRERFVPEDRRGFAYIGDEIALGSGRYLMEAAPFARMLQLARIGKGDVVLDVGCGLGYSAAVLGELAASVVALEEDEALAAAAESNLAAAGALNASVVRGPLRDGYAKEGPFDVILFEGAVDRLPDGFFGQLRERGRLVVVEGRGNAAAARLYSKEDGLVSDRFGFNCSLRPLPGFEARAEFVF